VDFETATAKYRAQASATGQTGWGEYGSAADHQRYLYELPGRYRNRRRCYCGCGGKASHGGAVNGLAMACGCEMAMRRWVRTGDGRTQAELDRIAADREARQCQQQPRRTTGKRSPRRGPLPGRGQTVLF
jgi:hypothetical protein